MCDELTCMTGSEVCGVRFRPTSVQVMIDDVKVRVDVLEDADTRKWFASVRIPGQDSANFTRGPTVCAAVSACVESLLEHTNGQVRPWLEAYSQGERDYALEEVDRAFPNDWDGPWLERLVALAGDSEEAVTLNATGTR